MNTISIIGAGNMGFAIAQGLVNSGQYKKGDIYLSTIDEKAAKAFVEDGYNVGTNKDLLSASKLVILVVKPWIAEGVLSEIKADFTPEHVLASCVTGLSSETVFSYLGADTTFFRVMPNTGAMVGESMSSIADFNATPEQKELINDIFCSLGEVLFLPEDKMAAATAVAGCGTAYALRFIRAVTQAGVEIGLTPADAAKMGAQIAKGAAEIILKNNSNPEDEIDRVTTPGGVTIVGLNEMEKNGYSSAIIQGILAAYKKAK